MIGQVPSGWVTTYGQVARMVGRCTARMVGYALAATPEGVDIPWHRVINSKGEISARSRCHDENIQQQMLELEGVEFDRHGRVDLKKYLWPGPDMMLPDREVTIRVFHPDDEAAVIDLWRDCGLLAPQNDPHQDILAKITWQPELFFVGEQAGRIVAAVMAGYDGHRGWINYLGVSPDLQGQGVGRLVMDHCEDVLKRLGCPKINLQVRKTNKKVIAFYKKVGFTEDEVLSLGKRLNRGSASKTG